MKLFSAIVCGLFLVVSSGPIPEVSSIIQIIRIFAAGDSIEAFRGNIVRPNWYFEILDLFEIPSSVYSETIARLEVSSNYREWIIPTIVQDERWRILKRSLWLMVLMNRQRDRFITQSADGMVQINDVGYSQGILPVISRIETRARERDLRRAESLEPPRLLELNPSLLSGKITQISSLKLDFDVPSTRYLPLGDRKIDSVSRIYAYIESIDIETRREVLQLAERSRNRRTLHDIPRKRDLTGKKLWYFQYVASSFYIPEAVLNFLSAFAKHKTTYKSIPVPQTAADIVQYMISQDPNYDYLTPEHVWEWYEFLTRSSGEKHLSRLPPGDMPAHSPRVFFSVTDWAKRVIENRIVRIGLIGSDIVKPTSADFEFDDEDLEPLTAEPTDEDFEIEERNIIEKSRFGTIYLSSGTQVPVLQMYHGYVFRGPIRKAQVPFVHHISAPSIGYNLTFDPSTTHGSIMSFAETITPGNRMIILNRMISLGSLSAYFEMVSKLTNSTVKWYALYIISFFFVPRDMLDLINSVKENRIPIGLTQPLTGSSILEYYLQTHRESIHLTPDHIQTWYKLPPGFYCIDDDYATPDIPSLIPYPESQQKIIHGHLESLKSTGYETGIFRLSPYL